MLVPGGNLLSVALGALRGQIVGYQAWTGRTKDAAGVFTDTFAARVEIGASIQPLSKDRIQLLGLDTSKSYVTVYALGRQFTVNRDRGSDRFDYGGRVYATVDKPAGWSGQDGWNALICVDIGPFPE